MTDNIILENEWGVVRHNPTHNYIYHTFLQDLEGEDVRLILNTGLETMRRHSSRKWLSDDRLNGPVSQEDLDWSWDVWAPQAVELGWTHWALVVPEALAGRASMVELVKVYMQLGVRVRVFADLDQARKWLIAQ